MAEESEYGPGASESSKKRSVRSGRKLIRIVIARHLLLALALPIALHGMGCEAEVIPLAEENRADDAGVAGNRRTSFMGTTTASTSTLQAMRRFAPSP